MKKLKADLLIDNAIELITCVSTANNPLGRIPNGAIAMADGRIIGTGSRVDLEQRLDLTGAEVLDAKGKIVAPGFVDCHTHLIFGGSRVKEFALKMTLSVAEIEAMGLKTGIPASIAMTRKNSEDNLFIDALDRLDRMLQYGTTTIESKSGYGISWPDELKMLRVNQRLAQAQPMDVVST
ncbi:MAG TPA: imidazolonepropionase, partial [Desulfobacteraceae bacterium]|nr:imidazolonepropionase [Desulfobacteraceae bacterium]